MKITKRRLRRIIKEMHPRAGVDNAIADYLDFVEAEGHVTPASASVIASYFISIGSWSAPDMRVLGDQYGIAAEDIQREVSIQRREMSAGGLSQEVPELTSGRRSSWQVRKEKELGESKMKITKRQLRRIIREEKARLTHGKLLKETLRDFEVMDELEAISEMAGKLLSALDTGGIETPDMGGLTAEQQELMRRPLENIRHEMAELLNELTSIR